MPNFFKVMNTRLNGKLFMTGRLSIADFALGAFLSQTVYNPANPHQEAFKNVVKSFPNIEKFWANFEKENARHLKERPQAFF